MENKSIHLLCKEKKIQWNDYFLIILLDSELSQKNVVVERMYKLHTHVEYTRKKMCEVRLDTENILGNP